MIRSLLAAISFLTRLPVPASVVRDASDIGRSATWFPVVGALLGGLQWAAVSLLATRAPPALTAVLVLALSALVTGALHLDGLADTVDGFGGGCEREDVLRIMRDHAIGAFGAVALILVLATKGVATAALLSEHRVLAPLAVSATVARWSVVALGAVLPYARREGGLGASLTDHVGHFELLGATTLTAAIVVGLAGWRGAICWGVTVLSTVGIGLACQRRIGGVTGDTLGASVELNEALALVVMVALR